MDMLKVQEYDFHCKYSVFEDIEICFSTNPFEVINTFCLGRLCSSLYFPWELFEVGFHLPLPSLVRQFLHYSHIDPVHIHSNIIHVLMGIFILNFIHEMDLDLEEVLFICPLKLSVRGKFLFCVDSCSLQLVMGLPKMNKGVVQGNVVMSRNWGCNQGLPIYGSLRVPGTKVWKIGFYHWNIGEKSGRWLKQNWPSIIG